ncbi:acetate/propionate family kinase [Reyranella sp.]|uniref:acetate/propionate family kinase n=1 Tax=Reyranella sp. TaxID=1929291 RepID=UPI000BCB6EF2|nr:acetate/propionate family kinase [Reyranella sp.]OYY37234.1 MAG: acetate kinase [Rhodospirillales bacterium 35-66-84]OYZ94206.1 MAG: acetate kinase [Rhodospirillales bacterium 24-66-33]OZB23046.1 MAG: acetate kinase [Rhodospirillales bacterium 39-66-50]HQS17223.1 acetate/propionate family kinase [Reyranella sp.]HQT13706.1 acetate/propionate family kinase [Reyranella sp.]
MPETGCIAVLNAGSSSIKFALYDSGADGALLYRGQVERIGVGPHLEVRDAAGQTVAERKWPDGALDHPGATVEILAQGQALLAGRPVLAFGHRVVHGGTTFAAPVRIDRAIVSELEALVPLAPLHQPHNLAPIAAILDAAPHLPQIACFDTAFHRTQPMLAQEFALPRELTADGVRRYGFHGLSYDFVTSRLRATQPALAQGRLIIAHLGNGASLCATRDGRSVASTMGFTALDGLMMGTRAGALDPGVLLYLAQQRGLSFSVIEDLLYRRSGLLGVSGISSDMRTLRASTEPAAREAIDLFVYRIVREIGSLAAALGGVDGIVFTAGIGEHDAATRAEILQGCRWLGVTLDPARNLAGGGRISADGSAVSAWIVPTDEERMIAHYTRATLANG